MFKYFFNASLILFLVFQSACGDGTSGKTRRRHGAQQPTKKAELPAKGAKIALIFPAGAGAMRVALGVTEKMESDLGLPLGDKIHMAGGVSSGALTAAAVSSSSHPRTSAELKAQMGSLVRTVFPLMNELVDKLMRDHNFTLEELEQLFVELMKKPPDFSSPAKAENDVVDIMTKAAIKVPSLAGKVSNRTAIMASVNPIIAKFIGADVNTALNLKGVIDTLLGDSTMASPENAKLIAIASHAGKPVYFAAPALDKFIPGPLAEGSTNLWKALVSSAAIPHVIRAPNDIAFRQPGSSSYNVIAELQDGFFADNVKFDPSSVLYDIFTKQFAGEELVMIFIGNGAPVDGAFRTKLKFSSGVAQTESNGKKVTFVAIDTKIVSSKGKSLFNLSGFYDSPDLAKYMDKASSDATTSNAYKWAIDALKAALP